MLGGFKFGMGIFLIILILISGCYKSDKTFDSKIANPASVYCEEQGGIVDIRINPDGSQTGYCVFKEGSECEEWAFYRGECQK